MRDILSAVSETGPNQDGRRNAPGSCPPHSSSLDRAPDVGEPRRHDRLPAERAVAPAVSAVALATCADGPRFGIGRLEPRLLSEVVFVLILTEVYRLLIFYLREHRISVALTIEVALVSTLREVMLKGAHEFP